MAEIRPDGQYMLWDGQDWNILNGPPGANGLDGNMTELWQTGVPPDGAPGSRWVDSTTLVEYVWDRTNSVWSPISGGGGGSAGHAIQDEGAVLPTRGSIDFVGDGVTATDDSTNNKTVVSITGLGSGLDQATADGLYVKLAGDTMDGDLLINGAMGASGDISGDDATFATLNVGGAAQINGATALNGAVQANSTVTLSGDPAEDLQAATKQYVDSRPTTDSTKVLKAGDTMTGNLTLKGDPTANLHPATKQYADTKLPKAGGTMTGALTLSGAPTSSLHAATKKYVDDLGIAGSRIEVGSKAPFSNASGVLTIAFTSAFAVAPIVTFVPGDGPGFDAARQTYIASRSTTQFTVGGVIPSVPARVDYHAIGPRVAGATTREGGEIPFITYNIDPPGDDG